VKVLRKKISKLKQVRPKLIKRIKLLQLFSAGQKRGFGSAGFFSKLMAKPCCRNGKNNPSGAGPFCPGSKATEGCLPKQKSEKNAGVRGHVPSGHSCAAPWVKLMAKPYWFFQNQYAPIADSLILKILPVLPPDLRPILKTGQKIAVSDLNRLYQKIIYRNDRLKKFLKEAATTRSEATRFSHRLLQESVDNLIENGKGGVKPETDSRGRALKSLSVILKGKSGRFRQHLLGKRVDYSGRSVIVVGPYLKMHECGIPYKMAIELFMPFLLKRIISQGLAQTVVGAKTVIRTNRSLTENVLREIMGGTPVILNRAPTLHRLGIQSFLPILVAGKAIILHPLVCTSFNADFDGDQMGVHVPLTAEARAEALKLMLSRNNLFSPATGEPLAFPTQDMLLGIYFLTIEKPLSAAAPRRAKTGLYFNSIEAVQIQHNKKKISDAREEKLHSNIWVKLETNVQTGRGAHQPVEIRVHLLGNQQEIFTKLLRNLELRKPNSHRACGGPFQIRGADKEKNKYVRTTPGQILFNLLIQRSLFFA
jgi:DNA-directed RNA polymerase subunit beta'